MNYFIHTNALVESKQIGDGTRIWAFAHILPGARIGTNCNICDHVFIENDVIIGDRVTIKCGVQIWDGSRIEDDVFIGPNVTFTNDLFPRSKHYAKKFSQSYIKKNASIGANATILAGKTVGNNSMVGAGSVVTNDVPPNAIVMGNPARITGYVSASFPMQQHPEAILERKPRIVSQSEIPGVQFYQLPVIADMCGSLSFAEYGQYLPFIPKRYFLIFDVPSQEVRGAHAHKELHEFMVCVKGSCSVMVDNGKLREEYILNTPGSGLYIPPMVWAVQYKYTRDAILMVLASDIYDPDDYIRDYDQFIAMLKKI